MDTNPLYYQAVMAHFGTRYKLAQALGLGISATYTWPKGYIPPRHHARIIELMRGEASQDRAGATITPDPSSHQGAV